MHIAKKFKKTIESLINNHKSITIGNYDISIRRLITPTKGIIVSNICPTIPHKKIEEELKTKHDIKIINIIPNIISKSRNFEAEYNHIRSFTSQIYISPEHTGKIPEVNTIAEENISCYSCNKKKNGHNANQCPDINNVNLAENNKTISNQIILPTETTPNLSTYKNLKRYTSTSTITDSEPETTSQYNKREINKDKLTLQPPEITEKKNSYKRKPNSEAHQKKHAP